MNNINAIDVNTFIEVMDEWVKEPLFQKISHIRHERHWFGNLKFKENNYSDILRWLFDTDAGHGLSDFFLKRFIFSAISADKYLSSGFFSNIDVDLLNLNSLVVREVSVEKGFIDIIIVDTYNKFIIAIERKDGSSIRKYQLEKYYDWLKENYIDRKYKYLCVLSDGNDNIDAASVIEKNWIKINDDWLIDALKAVIGRDICSPFMESQFIGLAAIFDLNKNDKNGDAYFSGITNDINEFSSRFIQDIQKLRSVKPFGVAINKEHHRDAVSKIIPNVLSSKSSASSLKINKALHLLIKHHQVIKIIFDVNSLKIIEKTINKSEKWSGLFDFYSGKSNNDGYALQINHKKTVSENQSWPFWIYVVLDNKYNEDEDNVLYEKIRMYIGYNRSILSWGEEINENIENYIRQKYKLRKVARTIERNDRLDIAASAQDVVNAITPWLETLQEIADIISSKEG